MSFSSVAAAKADHHNIAKSLEKRFSGQGTYFIDGLGACGQNNGPDDFIVALNTPQYGSGSPGPQCFKYITITGGGKTAVAQIMDECPTCDYGSLDMSEGLFKHFNDLSVGEFDITWSFNDGSGGGGEKTTTKEEEQPRPIILPIPLLQRHGYRLLLPRRIRTAPPGPLAQRIPLHPPLAPPQLPLLRNKRRPLRALRQLLPLPRWLLLSRT